MSSNKKTIAVVIHNQNVFKKLIACIKKLGLRHKDYFFVKDLSELPGIFSDGINSDSMIVKIGKSVFKDEAVKLASMDIGVDFKKYGSVNEYIDTINKMGVEYVR